MEYNFREIEKKWQQRWAENHTYQVTEDESKKKFYVLNMFPYPSGAGLHVGHPLGYIASDIYARYKRLQGFNVLNPMGYDAYGLPAEQYAIQTGQHPAITTVNNINRYREQLDKIGFSFDWNREVRTCEPGYYHWTQWAFQQMFNSYYCNDTQQARPISELTEAFARYGNEGLNAACSEELSFTAEEWNAKSEKEQQEILMNYRIAYLGETMVNWCPQLGTVLADIEFTIFTTRADTMFGVTFMVLAPESELVPQLTTEAQKAEVEAYLDRTKKRTERERIADRRVTGVFSGSYAINPFTGEAVPVWISDYVLAGYGTGAIMAVPAHDSRDYAFAKHFNLPIVPLVEGCDVSEESFDAKEGIVCNSPRKDVTPYCDLSLNGLTIKEAIAATKEYVKAHNLGRVKVNYRLRDAIFSRQRYWGEPFPVYYKNGMPYMIDSSKLPLELPEVAKFLPTETGEPPLGHATKWAWDVEKGEVVENNLIDNVTIFPLELNTMPGFAGSSAYYLRYMDPHNAQALVSEKADHYWQNVDLYVGGTEHATGHLIYSRFWNKFLHDLGVSIKEEPFQKLVNQGMIQGRSNFVYRIKDTNTFVSLNLKDQYETTPLHVDVNIVSNDILDVEAFKAWRPEYNDAEFILEDGKYICGWAVEKMSKSMYNVVNPDMIVEKYGADTLRMYEMFLGPVEQSKPWDTNGIDGVHRFLKKLWNLFYSRTDEFLPVEGEPTKEELKAIHKLIKKVTGDIETFSYNTSISAFMICVNELTSLKCRNKEVLSNLIILLAPFAPHYAEELWEALGNTTSVCDAQWPAFNEDYLKEDTVKYTISFNGKARFTMDFAADADNNTIQTTVMADEQAQKWIEGKTPKKVIIVPKKIVNIVL